MKFSAFRVAIALATTSVLLLAGCGGGGGSSTTTNPASNISSAITKDNAQSVGAQAYWALDYFLNRQIISAASEVTSTTSTDLSDRCPGGGSATRTVNGDTITLAYADCDDGFWKSNGTTTIQVSNIQGNRSQDAWSGTLTIALNFNTKFADQTISDTAAAYTGDLTIQYHQTAPKVGTFDATNNSLQWRLTSGNSAIERNISQLVYSGEVDSSNLNRFNASFTLAGKLGKLGNVSYAVKTKTDFKRQIASDQSSSNPSQGVMIVTASDNSSLTFTVADTTSARLGIDRNGDNVIDENTAATWLELSSLFYQFN